jgi:hypothetical protein
MNIVQVSRTNVAGRDDDDGRRLVACGHPRLGYTVIKENHL